MRNKNYKRLAYILGILPVIVLAFVYNKLPAQVPTHWDIDGTVTFSDKWQIWMLASMGMIFAVLFNVMPKIDPRKENYKKFGKYYDGFCLVMIGFMDIMYGIILSESFAPGRISVSKAVMILIGFLFIFLGNIMPKIKNNFYMGVKTPWTLSNEDVWNKTHRLSGKLMFGLGIIMVICGFLIEGQAAFWIMMAGVLLITLIPTVMSYIWYKRI